MEKRLLKFISDLKRHHVRGSYPVAVETLNILKIGISRSNGRAKPMMEVVKYLGLRLTKAAPLELAIGNVVRRVLAIIREEYAEFAESMKPSSGGRAALRRSDYVLTPALESILSESDQQEDYKEPYNIKNNVLDTVSQFVETLGVLYKSIADQALEHIHAQEVILTFGRSRTVEEFLKTAARKRDFEVIVAEAAPGLEGREMAKALADAKIPTTLISDSAAFAMMARVNKVLLGVHAVLANGGLVARTGSHMIAQAANFHAVPVVVLAGLYKLTPLYPYDQDTFNDLSSPASVLPFEDADNPHGVEVIVKNPMFDYVPPELVSVLVSNQSAHNPTYIYRLLAEFYHQDDHDLQQ